MFSAEATTEAGSETGTDAATETTTAQKNPGYGSYKNIKLGLDLKGGVYIVYQADKDNPTEEEMNAAVSMLQERVAYKGWYDAEVSKENTTVLELKFLVLKMQQQLLTKLVQQLILHLKMKR